MDSTKTTYATFPFEWTVKSTSYKIQYRKAFNINDIDEIFCSIINAKGNEINISELGILLGFNLQDLAELDLFKYYLKGLNEYNLIEVNEKEQIIQLTEFGREALQSKLKYKCYFATTELFENQTATGETFDFSFKNVFDIENSLSHLREIKEQDLENLALKQKLQFQLFGNDIYKGEIVVLYKGEPIISYKTFSLQTEITAFDNTLELSIFKSGVNKFEVEFLIGLPENAEFKSKLLRQGMYHHILLVKTSITRQDIETYIDLWNWKELAGNPKLDWNDNTVFELFRKNGDGGIWSNISEKAPIESIKSVIEEYADYWNWTTLTERFDDEFIKEHFDAFNWDFEELSYRESDFIQEILLIRRKQHLHFWNNEFEDGSKSYKLIKDLAESKGYEIECLIDNQKNELIDILTLQSLGNEGWDWNYLSKNLSNEFIEKHVDDLGWDFYLITELKGDILRNLFKNQGKSNYTNILLSKPWNWKFISKEFKANFLYEQIHFIASKVDWHIVLERFFTSEEITSKCLKDESFKSLLKQHLPENFVIAHQRYLWTPELIDFFENQNLIQWETQKYIIGFDTNENVEWSNPIFKKYHNRIISENGFLNVSKQISDYSLINDFPDFAWNWEGISQNKKLISNAKFIEKAFLGELSYSNNLLWNEILSQSTFDVSFWNKNLDAFYNATKSEKQIQFWKTLTQKERTDFVFANIHFPWDWSYITENSSEETILDSFEDDELFEKWDWKIATRKIDKDTILELIEDIAQYVDWKYLVNDVFTIENELAIDKQLPKIAAYLTVVDSEKRKEYWKDITCKIPFETLFPIVQATNQLDVFEWDWDYISNHKYFPTDFRTLNEFKEKINWDIFSSSQAIQKKFTYKKDEWTYQEYFKYVLKYLKSYSKNWNWNTLSKISDLNNNRDIVSIFQENWDWNYLSEFGGFLLPKKRDKDDYLLSLISGYSLIEFTFLSKRKDIKIYGSLILEYKDKIWDWQVLSENERAEISNELILELKDKSWNWQALSKRKNIEFSNETLLQLLDKDWDWQYLSENANLEFNAEFIEKTKAKSWNWKLVSRHKSFSPSVEILTLTKNYDLDWQYISKHSSLNPTKEILAKFENKWDWQSITENPQINFDDIGFLERFADKWNWRFICESGKLALNNQILTKFKEYLEWNLISSNTNLHFTKEIIQEFKQFWNWSNLKANKRVEELLGSYVTDEINKNATLSFIDKIEQQWSEWKGCIYHFSHIDNAVKIIREGKIKSRKTANQISDSAGNVVYSRDDAHSYARFYFRPHTQTQFYNEYLGVDVNMGYNIDGEWHSWYEREYRMLDFPKCPKPIYFEFSLQEILFTMFDKCNISTGNMQRKRTKFGKIENLMHLFNFEDLFINPGMDSDAWRKFREFAQQELMIKNELDFSKLNYYKIICANEEDKNLLIQLLGIDSIDFIKNIEVNSSYYRNENPVISHSITDDEIHISTFKKADGYFVLTKYGSSQLEIIDGDLIKQEGQRITFKSFVKIKNPLNKNRINVKYVDEINQEWFIFSNYALKSEEFENIKQETEKRKKVRFNQIFYTTS
ncbi:MAG TPA: DarT ssDNA thymidine ADP-ribosyltransferase family protein [Saprospiraceae bacterium]|nr:DarT ssDNA thymidine ADP-ribosyltransferase family protein [Saprospiraceae bacterium]